MSNWIDDARAQAEIIKRNNLLRIQQEETLRLQREEERKNQVWEDDYYTTKNLPNFRSEIPETMEEIEKIITLAKVQGLNVKARVSVYSHPKVNNRKIDLIDNGLIFNVGNFETEEIEEEHNNRQTYTAYYSKYIRLEFWIPKYPPLTLVLGIMSSEDGKTKVPTASAPEIEDQIKVWLVKIFSEQK